MVIQDRAPALGRIVVTGGSSGLGAATCEAIRAAGGDPVSFDLLEPESNVGFVQVDVTDYEQIARAVAQMRHEGAAITGLVCCAGIDRPGRFDEIEPENWAKIVAVNVFGTAFAARALLPDLQAAAGRLVVVGSTMGLRGFAAATAYCASKAALVGFSRAFAAEMASTVGVTLLMPSGIRTPFFDAWPSAHQPQSIESFLDPKDVARTIVFALRQPAGSNLREIVMTSSSDTTFS